MAEHLLILTLAIVATTVLIVIARRGKRIGTDPHCAECNYNLSGNTSGRCPECGAELETHPPRAGRHAHRPVIWVVALLALVFTVLFAYPFTYYTVRHDLRYRHYDWWPLGLVMNDLDHASFRSMAGDELVRRLQASELTPAQVDALRTDLVTQIDTADVTPAIDGLLEVYAELVLADASIASAAAEPLLRHFGVLHLSSLPEPEKQYLPHPNDHALSFIQSTRAAIREPYARLIGLREIRVTAVDDKPVEDAALFGVAGVQGSGRRLLDFDRPAERSITLSVTTDWYVLPPGTTVLDHEIPGWQTEPFTVAWLRGARPLARVTQQATITGSADSRLKLVPSLEAEPPAAYTPAPPPPSD
jgi:hypothetical protein